MSKKVNLESLLFCSECKKTVSSLEDLYFVSEESDHGFCSEDCIETFYSVVVNQLQAEEVEMRNSKSLPYEKESLNKFYDFETGNYHSTLDEIIEANIESPLEQYSFNQDLFSEIFIHISKAHVNNIEVYIIHLCLHYEDNCSLILFTTISEFKEIADYYRAGLRINPGDHGKGTANFEISKDQMEELELKKSSYLADLICNRSEEDIRIEDFINYQQYTRITLEEPDEIYEYKDDELDTIRSYIKTFKKNDETFFYVCVCQLIKNSNEGEVLMPLLTFPSKDTNLYKNYKLGNLVNQQIRN